MFRAIAIIGILQVLTILVQVVRAKVISVVLGPAGLGTVGLIDQMIAMVATICSLSLPTVVLRIMPRVYGKPEFKRQYASFLKGVILTSVVGTAILAAVLLVQPRVFGDIATTYSTEIGVALASVPLLALGLLLPNVLAASLRPIGAASLSFGVAAAAAVAAAAGLLLGGIREIYVAQAIVTSALLAGALVYFKFNLHLPFHDPEASLIGEIRARPDIIPTAVAVYASLVGTAVALLTVRYVTARSMGIEAVGWLQSILSMVLAVGAVLVAMAARYLSPLLNQPSSKEEKFALANLFRRRQLMILIALTVPLVLFANIALTIMFSSKFTGAAAWLPAFLIWQLLVIQTNVQLMLLFSLDEIWTVTVMSIAGSALSGLLCVLLIPTFGLSGGAVAMIAGAGLTMTIAAVRLRRHGYSTGRSSILLGGYAVVVLLAAPYLLEGEGLAYFAIRVVACGVLVGGLWFFLDHEEKAAILSAGRKRVAGTSVQS
jgi:O-antigen/teichoic acid export membrane protein